MTNPLIPDPRSQEHLQDPEQFAASAISAGVGINSWQYGIEAISANQTITGVRELIGLAGGWNNMPVTVPFRGSVIGLGYTSHTNVTAGIATWEIRLNLALISGATLVCGVGTNKGFISWPKGKFPFAAGDTLDLRMTTNGSFTPASTYFLSDLYVYLDQSTLL